MKDMLQEMSKDQTQIVSQSKLLINSRGLKANSAEQRETKRAAEDARLIDDAAMMQFDQPDPEEQSQLIACPFDAKILYAKVHKRLSISTQELAAILGSITSKTFKEFLTEDIGA